MIRDISAVLGENVTGIGYRFWNDSGPIGSRVTSGISNPSTGVYLKRNVTVETGATGVHWDNSTGDIFADEDFENNEGTGAFTVTVTVTDETDPIQGVTVRVSEGITPVFGTTDVNGQVSFALNAGTYSVAVTKSGYQFTPVSRTVTGTEAGTLTNDLEMTQTIIPDIPADPLKGSIYGSVVVSDDSSKSGVSVTATLIGPGQPYKVGGMLVPKVHHTLTNDDGQWSFDLYGNADITPAGTYWRINVSSTGFDKNVTIVSGQQLFANGLI